MTVSRARNAGGLPHRERRALQLHGVAIADLRRQRSRDCRRGRPAADPSCRGGCSGAPASLSGSGCLVNACRTVANVVAKAMPRAMQATISTDSVGLRLRLFQAIQMLCSSIGVSYWMTAARLGIVRSANSSASVSRTRAVEQVDVSRGAGRALGRVRHHDDRRALLVDPFEQVHHLARHQRVEVAGRLVGQDQLRVAGEDARDRHALLLTARELRRQVTQPRRQADHLDGPFDARLALLARRQPAVAQRHVDVVEHVEIGNQVEGLEDEPDLLVADLRHLAVGEPADVLRRRGGRCRHRTCRAGRPR